MKKIYVLLSLVLIITVLSSISLVSAGAPQDAVILFSENFDKAATPEAAGINTTELSGKTFTGAMAVTGGQLFITTPADNGSTFAFEFVTAAELAGIKYYTIEFDVKSTAGGINSAGNDYSIGIEVCRKSATDFNCLQLAGKTFNLAFASAKVADAWERAKATYRFDTSTKGITTGLDIEHHITVAVDRTNNIMTYSIDGIDMNDPSKLYDYDSGIALEIYGKSMSVYIDNLTVWYGGSAPETTPGTTAAAVITSAPVITTAVTTAAVTTIKKETTATPATVAPATTAKAETTAEPLGTDTVTASGCGSAVSGAIILLALCALPTVLKSGKKR